MKDRDICCIIYSYCLVTTIKLMMNENLNTSPICGFDACNRFKYLWTTYETKMYNPIYFYFKEDTVFIYRYV